MVAMTTIFIAIVSEHEVASARSMASIWRSWAGSGSLRGRLPGGVVESLVVVVGLGLVGALVVAAGAELRSGRRRRELRRAENFAASHRPTPAPEVPLREVRLHFAISHGEEATRQSQLALARIGDSEALMALRDATVEREEVRRVLDVWIDKSLARTAAQQRAFVLVLGEHDLPRAQEALCALLGASDEAVLVAALALLGTRGTITAVSAMVPLRDERRGGPVRDAATAAILAIQARAGTSEAGALALASHEGGELALAGAESPPDHRP